MGPDEIRLAFLSQSVQFATAYGAVGRYADYVAKFDDALARLAPTNENVELRVSAVGISLDASHIAGDFERAERCLPVMQAIADDEPDADSAARLHGLILTWEIQLARARNDAARITAKLQEALSLLDRLEKKGSSARALGGFRHNLAHHLNQSGRYDLALPVLDAKLAAGGGSHGDHGYAWLMHATADAEPDADSAARLHGRILAFEIQLARARNDAGRITAKLHEALSLLDRLEKKGSSAPALGEFRHNLAHHLNQSGRYDLALPVLDAQLAAGDGSHGDHGYAWLMHAAAVWQVTRDRPRTLALLREARDHDPRDLTDYFRTSAFNDVQDDPEFLQAISRK